MEEEVVVAEVITAVEMIAIMEAVADTTMIEVMGEEEEEEHRTIGVMEVAVAVIGMIAAGVADMMIAMAVPMTADVTRV
jgi:hypothetical protein